MIALLFLAVLILAIFLADIHRRLKRAEAQLAQLEPGRVAPQLRSDGPEKPRPPVTPPAGIAPDRPTDDAPPVRPPTTPAPQPVMAMASEPVATVAQPAAAAAASPPAGPARLGFSFEDFFGRRLPIWAGGITLAVAGVLIVNYALAAGLLTPWVQVAAVLMFGFGLLAGAEAAQQNRLRVGDARVAQALAGAGLATLYAAAFVAGNVHGLIGPIATFAAMAVVTAAALALAGRFGAPTALLALAGGLATPALIDSADPNIPLLSGYLALTVAGLTAVGRGQRWAWLGLATLAGGGLWTLFLIASGALDFAATLSVGALVILLAVAVPLLGHVGARGRLVQTGAMLIGLAQLGALVANGGYAPETWAMYALIAAAGQWLAWRDPAFAIVPRLSAGLTAMLLLLWPDPALQMFAIVGIAMLLIHVIPLHIRHWTERGGPGATADLCAIAIATLLLPWLRFSVFGVGDAAMLGWRGLTLIAVGAAAIGGIALATGWRSAARTGTMRYAQLASVTGLLLAVAAWFGLPLWSLPVALAALAVALLFFGEAAGDQLFERVALGFAALGVAALGLTDGAPASEWPRLVGVGSGGGDWHAIMRWAAVLAAAALVAWRAQFADVPKVAQAGAAGLGYGLLAQILPVDLLMLAPGVALVAIAAASHRAPMPRLEPALTVAGLLLAGWAAEPLMLWAAPALASLAGIALIVPVEGFPDAATVVRRLLLPALLLGAAIWLLRGQVGSVIRRPVAVAAVLALVAVHALYRHGFAAAVGGDFVASGVAQRLVWGAALLGAAFAIARLAAEAAWRPIAVAGLAAAAFAHGSYYGLVLHNPLWAEQAVGSLPVVNWLLPLYALPALAAWLVLRQYPAQATRIDVPVQIAAMIAVVLLALSTLRQAFSGSLLMAVPVGQAEDVLRSLLAIVLAIGFLLWGARAGRRDWRIASLLLMLVAVAKVFLFDAAGLEGLARIASFVALGFSLIGIGWFYSRQLRSAEKEPSAPI